jgi:hypothetical protein
LTWIENTAIAEYVRVSAYGYPAMITLHSLGLAIMVGLSVVLSLRAVGMFSVIPYSSLAKLLKVAWIGFIINVLSGTALFSTNAIAFMGHTMFLIKISMVIVGAILVAVMQSTIKAALATGNPEAAAGSKLKILGWATIAAWTIGMVTGRLIAYL